MESTTYVLLLTRKKFEPMLSEGVMHTNINYAKQGKKTFAYKKESYQNQLFTKFFISMSNKKVKYVEHTSTLVFSVHREKKAKIGSRLILKKSKLDYNMQIFLYVTK